MTEAAGYVRLSQQSDTSIPRQKRNIREYCEQNHFDLLTIFDDGEQASGFDETRPRYQTLIDEVRSGAVDVVVMNDKRRIARDVDEVMRLVPDFRQTETELHTVRDGPLDLEDPLRAAIEIVSAAAAHEEKMQEIEKSIEAIREKQEQGHDLGRPRFGMRYDDADPPQQVPGEDFETVLEILRLDTAGHSRREIEAETGVPSSTVGNVLDRREWYVERSKLQETKS